MSDRVLLPHCFQLRLANGVVLHEYSRAGKELMLADYHIYSDCRVSLYMVPERVGAKPEVR